MSTGFPASNGATDSARRDGPAGEIDNLKEHATDSNYAEVDIYDMYESADDSNERIDKLSRELVEAQALIKKLSHEVEEAQNRINVLEYRNTRQDIIRREAVSQMRKRHEAHIDANSALAAHFNDIQTDDLEGIISAADTATMAAIDAQQNQLSWMTEGLAL